MLRVSIHIFPFIHTDDEMMHLNNIVQGEYMNDTLKWLL